MADKSADSLEDIARDIARGATRGILQTLRDWIFGRREKATTDPDNPRRVLILGPGGTGKTTLAHLLAGRFDWLDDTPVRYDESIAVEFVRLEDDPDVELVVAPGQPARRETSTWKKLLDRATAGEFRGVIFVSAFGYHSFSAPSYKVHELYETLKSTFLVAHCETRRREELRVLREIARHLSTCPKKLWLLSVVAKQDLWGSRQQDVEKHYRQGEYEAVVGEIKSVVGKDRFRHEIAFVALTIRRFETNAGELLQANEAGYDMRSLGESVRQLAKVMAGLKTWEDEQ